MFNHLSRPLGIVLAAIVLLAGPSSALGSECGDAWQDSSASESCNAPDINQMDYLDCPNCCRILTRCRRGTRYPWEDEYKLTGVITEVENVSELENCNGTLKVGSC